MEQKSERIENLVLEIISNLTDPQSFYQINSPPFIFTLFKYNVLNISSTYNLTDRSMLRLLSICNLTNQIDCRDDQTLTIKVN